MLTLLYDKTFPMSNNSSAGGGKEGEADEATVAGVSVTQVSNAAELI